MNTGRELLPEPLPPEPLQLVARWLAEAVQAATQPNPNAMVLATVGAHGAPSARVVLCKELRPQPGTVAFYTNYLSRKGRELAGNPRAVAVMHWDALGRQVRLEGQVTRTSAAESDAYFASRPSQSRLGAWASQQSQPIASRAQLVQAYEDASRRFGAPSPLTAEATAAATAGPTTAGPGAAIPRPPHWGGYRLWIDAVELWVEGTARLHDRARWQRRLTPSATPAATETLPGFDAGPWSATRLQP